MITKTAAFTTTDGKIWENIEQAKQHELSLLFNPEDFQGAPVQESAALAIIRQSEAVIDILTMTPNSKPSARSIHGGRKPRKAKTETAPTPA